MGLWEKPGGLDAGAFLGVEGAKAGIVTRTCKGFGADQPTTEALVQCSPF